MPWCWKACPTTRSLLGSRQSLNAGQPKKRSSLRRSASAKRRPMSLRIAYFVNQYPKVSHSFIRREILALERLGFDVQRIALRGWNGPVPDPEDRREREKTRYVLRSGALALLAPTLRILLGSPLRLFGAARLALRMARDSDR